MFPSDEELSAIEAAEPRARRLDWSDDDGELLASVVVGPPRRVPGEVGVPQAYRKWVDAMHDADQASSAANNLALTSCLWPAREKLRVFLDSSPEAAYTIADTIGAMASPDGACDEVKRVAGEWQRESGAALTEGMLAKLAAARTANPIARLWAAVVDVGAGEELVIAKPVRSNRYHDARALGAKLKVFDAAELLCTGSIVEPTQERFAAMVEDRPGLALVVGGAVRELGSPGAAKLGKAKPSLRGR